MRWEKFRYSVWDRIELAAICARIYVENAEFYLFPAKGMQILVGAGEGRDLQLGIQQ